MNNKQCALELLFLNEKIENDLDDFKVKFSHFLSPPHYTNSQNSIISMFQFQIFGPRLKTR